MKLYKHNNYEEYIKAQVRKNVRKLKQVWATPETLGSIANYIKQHIPNPEFGICHGVRNGWEVHQLRAYTQVNIIGTEISHTATQFKHVIEWDFHKIKPEWEKSVDIIYTNALDHSYDPDLCLSQWAKCLSSKGCCFIEWTRSHQSCIDPSDCFSANKKEYFELISKYMKVKDTLKIKRGVVFVSCSSRKII